MNISVKSLLRVFEETSDGRKANEATVTRGYNRGEGYVITHTIREGISSSARLPDLIRCIKNEQLDVVIPGSGCHGNCSDVGEGESGAACRIRRTGTWGRQFNHPLFIGGSYYAHLRAPLLDEIRSEVDGSDVSSCPDSGSLISEAEFDENCEQRSFTYQISLDGDSVRSGLSCDDTISLNCDSSISSLCDTDFADVLSEDGSLLIDSIRSMFDNSPGADGRALHHATLQRAANLSQSSEVTTSSLSAAGNSTMSLQEEMYSHKTMSSSDDCSHGSSVDSFDTVFHCPHNIMSALQLGNSNSCSSNKQALLGFPGSETSSSHESAKDGADTDNLSTLSSAFSSTETENDSASSASGSTIIHRPVRTSMTHSGSVRGVDIDSRSVTKVGCGEGMVGDHPCGLMSGQEREVSNAKHCPENNEYVNEGNHKCDHDNNSGQHFDTPVFQKNSKSNSAPQQCYASKTYFENGSDQRSFMVENIPGNVIENFRNMLMEQSNVKEIVGSEQTGVNSGQPNNTSQSTAGCYCCDRPSTEVKNSNNTGLDIYHEGVKYSNVYPPAEIRKTLQDCFQELQNKSPVECYGVRNRVEDQQGTGYGVGQSDSAYGSHRAEVVNILVLGGANRNSALWRLANAANIGQEGASASNKGQESLQVSCKGQESIEALNKGHGNIQASNQGQDMIQDSNNGHAGLQATNKSQDSFQSSNNGHDCLIISSEGQNIINDSIKGQGSKQDSHKFRDGMQPSNKGPECAVPRVAGRQVRASVSPWTLMLQFMHTTQAVY